MSKKNKPERFLVIDVARDRDPSYGVFDIWFAERPRDACDAGPGGFRHAREDDSFRRDGFCDLRIRGQWNRDHRADGRIYGFSLGYGEVFAAELEDLERMTRFLRRIHRKLDKLTEEFGYAETFTVFVTRVANALGIKKSITREMFTGDEEARPMDLTETTQWIRRKVANSISDTRAAENALAVN